MAEGNSEMERLSIMEMQRATKEAAKYSNERSATQGIDITVTTVGFRVRGRKKGPTGGGGDIWGDIFFEHHVPWSVFDGAPPVLTRAVELVARKLELKAE